MFVEEIKKTQGSKKYKSVLVRETFREDGKVKHRTIANISKLPQEYIRQLKMQMKNEGGEFDLKDLENGSSYEYGASFVFKELAKNIGLEQAIFSRKTQWREDVMAMITGRILYQGSKLSLVNVFKDSALWELTGHTYGDRPDVEKNCYQAMDELSSRKSRIEKKLAKKHLENGCIILYDITNFWLEGEYDNSDLACYGNPKGGKKGYKQIALGLLTNNEGCPVGVEVFKGNTSDQTTVVNQLKKISEKYGIEHAIFTGDRGMLTQKRVDEIKETDFVIITGGLGSTKDDITKTTLAELFNTKLVFNEEMFENIQKFLKGRGMKNINELNRAQAMVPESCTPIVNKVGSAPIMWFEKSGKVTVSMPGVPLEMKTAMLDEVIPRLKKKFRTGVIIHKTVLAKISLLLT